jgi:hypothetical protein
MFKCPGLLKKEQKHTLKNAVCGIRTNITGTDWVQLLYPNRYNNISMFLFFLFFLSIAEPELAFRVSIKKKICKNQNKDGNEHG